LSFLYNGRLPYYVWGHTGQRGGLGADQSGGPTERFENPAYQAVASCVHLYPPLEESGARQSWNNKSGLASYSFGTPAHFEGAPCDAQLPWKTIVGVVVGLTLNGEVYIIPPAPSPSFQRSYDVSPNKDYGRLQRWKSKLVQKPIRDIFPGGVRNSGQRGFALGVDKDGAAWWLFSEYKTQSESDAQTPTDGAESIGLPAGETAKSIYFSSSQYLLTTESNRTYIKEEGEDWIVLTTACVAALQNNVPLPYGGPTPFIWHEPLPTFTVSAPDEDGVTATVEPVWQNLGFGDYGLTTLRITNPGSGYTEDATVTPSSAAINATQPAYSLRVWSDYLASPTSVFGFLFACVAQSGKVYSIRLPDQMNETYGLGPYVQEIVIQTTNSSNEITGSILVKQLPTASPLSPGDFVGTDGRRSPLPPFAWCISNDDKLYRYVLSPVPSPVGFDGWRLLDDGPWSCIAVTGLVGVGVKKDGRMYTFGRNGNTGQWDYDNFRETKGFSGALFGDNTAPGTVRTLPVQIASQAEWVNVFQASECFIAIRKDAICREIGQPMEYFPDWHYQTQT